MSSFVMPANGLATQLQSRMGFGGGPEAQGPSGAFNVPNNLFGQQGFMPTGFSGYNANNANVSMTPYGPPSMSTSFTNPYNPGASFNPFASMMTGQGFGGFTAPGGYPGYQLPGNGLNPNAIDPSSILSQVAAGQGPGAAVNTLPAWQQMVQAQQYNIGQGADQLAEQFNNGGGLFSNAYGSAQGQYQTQARLGENAQLSQSQLQALLAAQGIQSGAASQLSSQGLQANMGLLNDQMNMLNIGGALGQQQYGNQQNTLNANYTQWLNSQPYMNPYLQMAFGAATGYVPQQYQPGWMSSLMGGVGGMASGAGSIMQGLPYV